MHPSDTVGTVASIWRFPVKSMLGEELDAADVGQGGIEGDRAYGLVDVQTGKVASAKHPNLWPDLLHCRATFVEPPRAGGPIPPVRIDLPDGTSASSDAPDAEAVLSAFFGREVRLARSAPDDFTIDQYHPDEPDYDPGGHRDEIEEVKLGAAFYHARGLPSAVPEGSFLDLFPLSVLTTSTVERLEELRPGTSFDVRRFRMNVIVDTAAAGFVENDWVQRSLAIGDDVRVGIALLDPRCVMPSLSQPGLPRDGGVLETLARHNRHDVAGGGLFPCAGVYAVTESGGTVRAGDAVALV